MDRNLLAQRRVSPRAIEDVLVEIRQFYRLKRELYPTPASLRFPTSGPAPRFDRLRRELYPANTPLKWPFSEPTPPRKSTRYLKTSRAKRIKWVRYEPMLEDIEEKEEPKVSEESEEPQTPTPIEEPSPDRNPSSAEKLGKKKSLSNLRLHIKRSAASLVSAPRKVSPKNDIFLYLGNDTVVFPQSEYNLRGKHWLLAARQVGSAATSQWHPHHPFIWTSQNLWCTACTRISTQVSWRPPLLRGGLTNPTGSPGGQHSNVPTDVGIAITPYEGAYRDIPLVCALCSEACCIHGAKKLEIMQRNPRTSNTSLKSRPPSNRSFKIPAQSDAEAELAEIEASFAMGPDAESFVTCMQTGCGKLVCPACAARCAAPLCGLILCFECWPEQEGVCGLHSIIDLRVDIPPHPTRPPPPPPPPRSPPPPPPSRPPPPPPVEAPPIPARNPKRLRRQSATTMPLWRPTPTLRLSKSLPSLRRLSARTRVSA